MKYLKRMLILMASICLLCGCTKSTIISGNQDYSELPPPDEQGIVWEQLWEDLAYTFEDEDLYPFVETVNGAFYRDKNQLQFFLLLNQDIPAEEAAEFATEFLKGFNDLIYEQNNDFAPSSEDSYGGFVSKYEVYVMVSEDGLKTEESAWILEDTIAAGEYRPVNPEAVPTTE